MKILVLPRGQNDRSRCRMLQFLPALTEAGHRCHVIFQERPRPGFQGAGRFRRWLDNILLKCRLVMGFRRFDVAWVEGFRWMGGTPSLWRYLLPEKTIYELTHQELALLPDRLRRRAAGVIVPGSSERDGDDPLVKVLPYISLLSPGHSEDPSKLLVIGNFSAKSPELDELVGKLKASYDLDYQRVREQDLAHPRDLHQMIANLDIALFPLQETGEYDSEMERLMLHCMASQVPILASRNHWTETLVEAGHCGYLLDDEGEWAGVLHRLLGQEPLRKDLGTNGGEWLRQFRNPSQITDELLNYFEMHLPNRRTR